jgi:hypothetical protein
VFSSHGLKAGKIISVFALKSSIIFSSSSITLRCEIYEKRELCAVPFGNICDNSLFNIVDNSSLCFLSPSNSNKKDFSL